jgi:hypothetical protein
MKTSKTGKREVACVFLALVLIHAGYVTSLPVAEVPVYLEITRIFVWPAVLFLGAAFGMEWAQQSGLLPPKQF